MCESLRAHVAFDDDVEYMQLSTAGGAAETERRVLLLRCLRLLLGSAACARTVKSNGFTEDTVRDMIISMSSAAVDLDTAKSLGGALFRAIVSCVEDKARDPGVPVPDGRSPAPAAAEVAEDEPIAENRPFWARWVTRASVGGGGGGSAGYIGAATWDVTLAWLLAASCVGSCNAPDVTFEEFCSAVPACQFMPQQYRICAWLHFLMRRCGHVPSEWVAADWRGLVKPDGYHIATPFVPCYFMSCAHKEATFGYMVEARSAQISFEDALYAQATRGVELPWHEMLAEPGFPANLNGLIDNVLAIHPQPLKVLACLDPHRADAVFSRISSSPPHALALKIVAHMADPAVQLLARVSMRVHFAVAKWRLMNVFILAHGIRSAAFDKHGMAELSRLQLRLSLPGFVPGPELRIGEDVEEGVERSTSSSSLAAQEHALSLLRGVDAPFSGFISGQDELCASLRPLLLEGRANALFGPAGSSVLDVLVISRVQEGMLATAADGSYATAAPYHPKGSAPREGARSVALVRSDATGDAAAAESARVRRRVVARKTLWAFGALPRP